MRRIITLIAFAVSALGASLHAQITILDQTLLNQTSFNTFTAVNVTGNQVWASTFYGAACNGYAGGQSYENEDWLISPAMNLDQMDNVKLTFDHTRGVTAVMNVGVAEGWYKAYATSEYTGNPATTQWIELTGLNQTVPTGWQFITSGVLTIPEAAQSATSRIAFRYISSATQSATWEIKNVKVVGEPQPTNPLAGQFKITSWNTEWLGCTTFGPTDESLQMSNVAQAMLLMNSDIYCIQEVTNIPGTIDALVALLGTDQWEGKMNPASSIDCDQKQGIIYKKARVNYLSSNGLNTGNAAQGNSYFFNWSNGRFPSVFNLNLVSGTTLTPITIVNIHAKAEDGNAMSYTRRLGGSEALKTILDGAAYNTKNVVLIGDFNDYLVGTSSSACACSDSPYKNFMDDTARYTGITQDLGNVQSINPLIDNMVLSNELVDNYVAGSAVQEDMMPIFFNNYYATTSNHLPVSAVFQFAVLENQEFAPKQRPLAIYPNPTKQQLRFDSAGLPADAAVVVRDLTGRQMKCERIGADAVDVTGLPVGVYILSAGNRFGKFVKE